MKRRSKETGYLDIVISNKTDEAATIDGKLNKANKSAGRFLNQKAHREK